ncbi:hypothetical protein D9Q98_005337 [Chlorella vulgaris]|uniref:C2 NT-type domain-containing protein n=1 Tax=Chlorella vulgaris TaxID=3077 RepID=A0A9D4TLU8_CHLVU|nr:hypothetical protein D9Q98_005337 [Chlorella vulgaris]
MPHNVALLLILLATMAALGDGAADFSVRGPCLPRSWKLKFPVPVEMREPLQLPATLSVVATVPTRAVNAAGSSVLPFGPAPFPVLFFFNGFMNRAAWYKRLMLQVASWGVATLQYDTPFYPLITAAAEVQLFPHLLQWVTDQGSDPSSPLYSLLDMTRVTTGGHSRGGKLATLTFTGNPKLVRAAYLVDPVDVTQYAPESPANPSAIRALRESGRRVGMSAAGILSSCNPVDAGYLPMWAAAANGSWLGVLPGASHSTFIDAGCITNAAADLLCRKGGDGRRQVAALTSTPLLAWLWSQLEGQGQQEQAARQQDVTARLEAGGSAPSPLPAFFAWVSRQQQEGRIEFAVRARRVLPGGARRRAMFRKLKQGLGKGSKAKYRLDVAVSHVEGLPPGVAACRLQWARGGKVAVTKLAPATAGAVEWREELSQIATLIKLPSGSFEPKEYEFKLQAPGGGQKPPATIGKAGLDMARFAAAAGGAQAVSLTVPVPGGSATLHLVVGAAEVKGMGIDDDAMSIMTGASGLSEATPSADQDLSGFRMDSSRAMGATSLTAAAAPASVAAASLSGSARPSSTVGQELSAGRSSTGGEQQQQAQGQQLGQQEVEALRQEVATRDARLTALQRELAAAHLQLATGAGGAAAAGGSDGKVSELEQLNSRLEGEVGRLRGELAAATSAAAAATAAAAVAASTPQPTADSEGLREQLAAAQARLGELEQQAAAAEAGARSRSSSGAGSEETAAKLAVAEQKIQQLMVLAQAGSGNGGSGSSEREAALEAALADAEREAEEAEAMAREAMEMAEAAQAEVGQLRAENVAMAGELNELQQQAAEITSSSRWKEEREAKRESDWDARLKEAYKRMEESVMLAERMQRERDELEDKCAVLAAEKQAAEAKLDPGAVDQQVALEVQAATVAAEAQARIEVEALQQRLSTMEEYVEEADARRLAMAGQVAALERQLAGVRLGEEDTYLQVKAAEDRADGLSLELQYAQSEAQRLAHELALLQDVQQRGASDQQRDLADACSRADAATRQLEEARTQARQEAALAGELRSRVLLVEEELEAAKLQLMHAQQTAVVAAGAGAALGGGVEAAAARRRLDSEAEERRRAAEQRAAQLEAVSGELAGAREELADAVAQRERAEAQLAEARHSLAASASELAGLEATLRAREAQLQQAQEAQRSSAALLMATRGRSSTNGGGGGGECGEEASGQAEEERRAHEAEVARISTQLAEAQQLAQYSASEMAGLVQQLAEAQADRSEVAAKLADAREEVALLRAGPDGELRGRIERLEKEAVIQRNRAEVNALFKEEHDRIAQELVETKLVWAEAQELIVKLKRSLVKAQERSVVFSNRLTKMETKMYSSALNGTADSMTRGAKKLGSKLSLRRGSKEREAAAAAAPLPEAVE